MPRAGDAPMPFERLLELAMQADAQGRCRFTPFLTPPEASLAEAAARRAGVTCALFGGYDGAERRIARFCPALCEPAPFPVVALRVRWPHQSAPAHRDLLGALMGLGLRRDRTGDIVLGAQEASLFVEAPLAEAVQSGLSEAGRIRLSVEPAEALPPPKALLGEEVRFTVASARLDAIVADGFHLSRGDAAALIEAGAVKLRHAPTLRPDARVSAGDAVSVRGHGRLTVETIGEPTRKGRLPVTATRHGVPRS